VTFHDALHLLGMDVTFESFIPLEETTSSCLIQVDIGGHPPILLDRKIVFHLGSFSTIFQVPNF
jgi:hypothetical protein